MNYKKAKIKLFMKDFDLNQECTEFFKIKNNNIFNEINMKTIHSLLNIANVETCQVIFLDWKYFLFPG